MINKIIKQKKGQVWTVDFIIGLILFIFVILVSISVLMDMRDSSTSNSVYTDAIHISDQLLLEGYPLDWNSTNVIVPGIAGNNRINESKILEFDTLDYYRAKTLLHSTSDFIFFISNSTSIQNISGCIHGYALPTDVNCAPILTDLNRDTLVKINRLVIYDSKVMVLTLYAWD